MSVLVVSDGYARGGRGTYESWVPSPTLPQWGFGRFPFLPHDCVREDFLLVSIEHRGG
jgi:hypothetical protein